MTAGSSANARPATTAATHQRSISAEHLRRRQRARLEPEVRGVDERAGHEAVRQDGAHGQVGCDDVVRPRHAAAGSLPPPFPQRDCDSSAIATRRHCCAKPAATSNDEGHDRGIPPATAKRHRPRSERRGGSEREWHREGDQVVVVDRGVRCEEDEGSDRPSPQRELRHERPSLGDAQREDDGTGHDQPERRRSGIEQVGDRRPSVDHGRSRACPPVIGDHTVPEVTERSGVRDNDRDPRRPPPRRRPRQGAARRSRRR